FCESKRERKISGGGDPVNRANPANSANSVIPRPYKEYVQRNLNWPFLIFKALKRVARVDDGIPSLAAAPDGPETRPLVWASAASIISRSLRGSISPLTVGCTLTREAGSAVSL